MHKFDADTAAAVENGQKVDISKQIIKQLKAYVTIIADSYKDNPCKYRLRQYCDGVPYFTFTNLIRIFAAWNIERQQQSTTFPMLVTLQ